MRAEFHEETIIIDQHMKTANHQNDTIVVNHPRMTGDDEITNIRTTLTFLMVSSKHEITITPDEEEGDELISTNTLTEEVNSDQKLYTHEMEEHILVPDEQNGNQQHNFSIVMNDGVKVQYASQHNVQSTETIVPNDMNMSTVDDTFILPNNDNHTIACRQETTTIKTDSGPIQIVKLCLPEDSEERNRWLNLLQVQHQA